MPDWLTTSLSGGTGPAPLDLAWRIAAALVLGVAVAALYRWARRGEDIAPTFQTTLVLLAMLIAMATQIIGDNVARAFSLVGALSVVRFRTVVKDTQDTAFVILAVVVGMAAGANHLAVGLIGLVDPERRVVGPLAPRAGHRLAGAGDHALAPRRPHGRHPGRGGGNPRGVGGALRPRLGPHRTAGLVARPHLPGPPPARVLAGRPRRRAQRPGRRRERPARPARLIPGRRVVGGLGGPHRASGIRILCEVACRWNCWCIRSSPD